MHVPRDYSHYDFPRHTYKSVDDFLSSPVPDGIVSMGYGDGLLELLLLNRGFNTTIVMFHAAVPDRSLTAPRFVGLKTVWSLKSNVVLVSDTILEKGVGLGWFCGDSHRNLQEDLPTVFDHVFAGMGGNQNLVFFGPSGGGFAALFYSHLFPGSLAVPVNPQTDIAKFHQIPVKKYCERAWGVQSPDGTHFVSDLVSLYSRSFPNYVIWLQNTGDEFHISNHLKPWLDAVKGEEDRFNFLMGDWGQGHAPAPPLLAQDVLRRAEEAQGKWDTLYCDDFTSHPETRA